MLYSVDQHMLTVAREIYDSGSYAIDFLPKPNPTKLPAHKTSEEWLKMSKPERAAWKYSLTAIHDKNAREVSKR